MASSDQLAILTIQEQDSDYKINGAPRYLRKSVDTEFVKSNGGEGINEVWRLKIAEWAYEVVDYFSLDREAVAIALNYVDRFMVTYNCDNQTPFSREKFQLLTVTALYLAIKLHGASPDSTTAFAMPTLQVFVELSRNRFTGADIEEMEQTILLRLKWKLNPPLPINFVKYFMMLLPSWQTEDAGRDECRCMRSSIYEMARYLAEIAICFSFFSFSLSPSVVAFASILTSIAALEDDPSVAHAFPPHQVLARFINNIFAATSLSPAMEDVKKARLFLFNVAPSELGQHLRRRRPSPRAVLQIALIGDEQQPCSNDVDEVGSAREQVTSPTEILWAFEQENKPTQQKW